MGSVKEEVLTIETCLCVWVGTSAPDPIHIARMELLSAALDEGQRAPSSSEPAREHKKQRT